jgi:TPR repeat protein
MSNKDTDDILREAFEAELSQNLDMAIKLFKRAARNGSNEARSKLGTIFDDILKPPNYSKAIYWYKKAVKGGDPTSAWNLAMHYAGLRRRRGYLYWLRIASKMGDHDAQMEFTTEHWWRKRGLS